jgi:hypothetical protein
MVSQPGRELILVTADLDPVDADRRTTMIDECAARVVHVVDMPLDEERETLGHGGVEACKVPCELDAVGTCASARDRRQTTRRQPPTASRMIGSTPASSHCFDDPAQAPDDHPCNGTLG